MAFVDRGPICYLQIQIKLLLASDLGYLLEYACRYDFSACPCRLSLRLAASSYKLDFSQKSGHNGREVGQVDGHSAKQGYSVSYNMKTAKKHI